VASLFFFAILVFKISFVIIILVAAGIGFVGGKFYPQQFPMGKGHRKSATEDLPAVVLPPAQQASMGRTVWITGICLTLWWTPVLAIGWWMGWGSIYFRERLFFSKAALVTISGAYAVLP
jgi:chromate transporter